MVGSIGTFAVGTIAVPTSILRVPPVPTITAPIGTVTIPELTVTWTYFSELARPQHAYRVFLASFGGGGVLFDSGIIEGAATSLLVDYLLSPFATYRVAVGVSDGHDGDLNNVFGPGWAFSDFSTQFSAAVDRPVNQRVGSVYEVAINGVGYMLEDSPDRAVEEVSVQLSPERLATGETPFAEAIDRYNFMAHADWTSGEGQPYLNRPRSDPSRYDYSEWINPFEQGEISCLPIPQHHITSDYVSFFSNSQIATVASGSVYLQTDDHELTEKADPAAANSPFDTGHAGFIQDITSDGTSWYATDGTTIRKNNTDADPGSNWSTEDVTEIEWCSDRIMGIDNVPDPRELISFAPAGGAGTVINTHLGATLRGLCGGDGYVWYGVNQVDTGEVRFWQVDSSPDVFGIALTLPAGETVDNLFFYLGNVFIAARTVGSHVKIYRCVPSEGLLTPQLIVDYPSLWTGVRVHFAGKDRFVAFAWHTMLRTARSGIGVIDLETSGYARWQAVGNEDELFGRPVTAVVRWADDFGVAITSDESDGGFYGKDLTPVLSPAYLDTSISDLATNVPKALSDVTLATRPLSGTVEVSVSTDSSDTFQSIGTMAGAGATAATFPATSLAASLAFRLELTPSGANGPVVKRLAGCTFPLGLADETIKIPVNCADVLDGLNDVKLRESRTGAGIARVRTLKGLVGQIVTFQAVDWPQTREILTYQVVAAQATLFGTYDRHAGYRTDHGICMVTLRRRLS